MTKEEQVHITLKQLSESLKHSPENFRLEDPEVGYTAAGFTGPTIVWQFKIQLKEGETIADPLNAARTVIVTFNKLTNQISCLIYFREVNTADKAVMPETQASVQCSGFPILNRTYRQFSEIRKRLIQLQREKEFLDYMKKLNTIFPSTHEDELFK